MAATAEAEVCNIALAHVGERGFIDSLADDSTQGVLCATLYPATRRNALERYDWSFARKRATLAASVETRAGWSYCYSAPSDCLAPRHIYSGLRAPPADSKVPFGRELRDDGGGLLLLSDLSPATLVYTVDVIVVPLWTALFLDAVALGLAARLAASLTVKPAVAVAFADRYERALAAAYASDMRQQREDVPPRPGGIRARGV